MHKAEIGALVKKRGTNMVQLALAHGLSRSAIHYALHKPSIRAETVLIKFLGERPNILFPARYDAAGRRLIRRGQPIRNSKPARRAKAGQ